MMVGGGGQTVNSPFPQRHGLWGTTGSSAVRNPRQVLLPPLAGEAALFAWWLGPGGLEGAVLWILGQLTVISPSFPQFWIHYKLILPMLSNPDVIDTLQHHTWLLLGNGKITDCRSYQFFML